MTLAGTRTCYCSVLFAKQDSVSRHSGLERDWAVTQPLLKMKISNEPIVRVELGFTHGGSVLCYYKAQHTVFICFSNSPDSASRKVPIFKSIALLRFQGH